MASSSDAGVFARLRAHLAARFRLYEDWRRIALKAWSSRFIALAFVATILEVTFPLLDGYLDLPRGTFAALSGVFAASAFVARLVAQKSIDTKDTDR